ncbi:MAG TPA: glutathione S-transferase family protein [Methylophilaceae bacterium]|jgi:glutathione S-transferase
MLKLYGSPGSRSTRVAWALEEAGADYDFILTDLKSNAQKDPEFLKLNPSGKLPVLVDNDLVLSESAAICTYIGERFPASGLVPSLEQAADRAHYFQWCFFAMNELEAPLWTMSKHSRLLPEEHRVAGITPSCLYEFENAAIVLMQHMEDREYAVGTQFTAADILLGGTLNWARGLNIVLPGSLKAYAKRMNLRPALDRAKLRERQV